MKLKALNFFGKFLTVLIGIMCVAGTVACYINNSFSWVFALNGLLYPVLVCFQLFLILFWLFKKSKWWIFSLFCFFISINQLLVILPPRFKQNYFTFKNEQSLRVLSWNVNRWDERNKKMRGGVSYRPLMLDYIESTGADVVCLQEFFECLDPQFFAANIPELKKRGFVYHSFIPSTQLFEGKFQYGLAIFSRFPIRKTAYSENYKSTHSEGLLYADIDVNGSIVRIYNLHLETPGIGKADYTTEGKIKPSYSVFSKIKNSYALRNLQARSASSEIQNSPYPVIMCADLGDVPNSYAYHTIKRNNQDAFLKKGAGLGGTLRHTSPTLRIDYIFAGKDFHILQFDNNTQIRYSDHYPLLADFQLTNNTSGHVP
jgi:endonuclease/exonuclease/phosphatase family metal-dependent hydrolase